ncbi:MAG: arylsulfatase [Verrucomicrobia bacterium]|nr:arylsulfatase [Verrucomicrobiota bacterium]
MKRVLLCFAAAGAIGAANVHAAAERPNIVVILADDMGYGDPHILNPESKIPTPNLDRLARQGMTFTDAHTPAAVCTPTRYGLLTGRYCWRSRLKRGVLFGYSEPLIEKARPTIASFLKRHGYYTGVVGKWHLGLGWVKDKQGKVDFAQSVTHGPNELGFDFSYIVPASMDMSPYVYLCNGRATALPTLDQPRTPFPAYRRAGPRAPDFNFDQALDHLLGQACGFIKRRAKEKTPFFLYFALTAPHKPCLPHPRFRGRTRLGPYGDFVVQVDWTVGQVLQTLDECGAADNTLVVYTSDNGSYMYRRAVRPDHVEDPSVQAYRPEHHKANGNLRGTKADIWEGGHRVPFFVRWPGHVEAGARASATVCLTDLFATFADLLDATVPDGAAEDSFSFLPYLEGRPPRAPRPPVIHHSGGGMFAVRWKQWKLVLGNGSGGREKPRGKPFARPYTLFDVARDLGEQHNLVDQYPEVAETLEKACIEIIDGKYPDLGSLP